MDPIVDYKKLNKLLKNMKYVCVNYCRWHEIEKRYYFKNPNFQYRITTMQNLTSVDSKCFGAGFEKNILFLRNTAMINRDDYTYRFYSVAPVEISKLFVAPKDLLNIFVGDDENIKILEYKMYECVQPKKLKWIYNGKSLIQNYRFYVDNITDKTKNEIDFEDLCNMQRIDFIKDNCIYLKNGGYFRFLELNLINIEEAIIR
jgi:hypothetical protein